MTNSINLAALGFGGIDTSSLVSSLVNIEQQPLYSLQNQAAGIQNASATISSFSSTLSALSSAVSTLSDPMSFESMQATSSNPSIVATASGGAPAGQWSVSVSQIAQAQRTLSNGTASSSTALGLSGSLSISVGGQQKNISVASTDTLSSIANSISSAGLPVQTSIMYDGSQYHLLVNGLNSGAANAITFNESGLTGSGYTLGLSTPANTIESAQNAQLTVGGVAVTSATNQITNAIPGVTLAVTQPTTSAATVNVASNPSAVVSQVQSFVSAYNNVVASGHSAAGYGTQAASNSMLQGDSAVRSSLDQLSQLVAEQVPGTSGAYTTLGSVGISLNDDGTLSLNSSQLTAALQASPSSVAKLFVTDPTTGATGVMSQFTSAINSLTDPTSGAITAELNGFSSRTQEITSQESQLQVQIAEYTTQIQNEFSHMNSTLAQYKQIGAELTQATNSNSGNSNGVI